MNRQKLWPYSFQRSEKTTDLTRLPRPTNQPDQLKQDLSEFGYCLYDSAFSLEKLDEINRQIYLQIEAEKNHGLQIKNETGSTICANLLNKDEVFQSLVTIPEIDVLVEHLLGYDFLLSSLSVVQTQPGTKAQGLHIDQAFLQFEAPVACVVNVIWMIEDFSDENGGTRVIPGSHLWDSQKTIQYHEDTALPGIPFDELTSAGGGSGENPSDTIAICAKAGTCLILDGRVLHGTGRNTATKNRTAVAAYYTRPYIRQLTNPFISIEDSRLLSLSDRLKEQLGFKSWFYFGGAEIPGRSLNLNELKPQKLIGKL